MYLFTTYLSRYLYLCLSIYTILKYFKLPTTVTLSSFEYLLTDNIHAIIKMVGISVTQYVEVWSVLLIKCFTILMTD